MCDWCTKHGAGKKRYMNARNYSNELAYKRTAFLLLAVVFSSISTPGDLLRRS